jgi:ribosome-associated translation inhibitor RaiA
MKIKVDRNKEINQEIEEDRQSNEARLDVLIRIDSEVLKSQEYSSDLYAQHKRLL